MEFPELTITTSTTKFSHPLQREKTGEHLRVGFDAPKDPFAPRNWPRSKKISTTVLYSLMTMGSTWATSSYAPAFPEVAKEFHVSKVVSTLGTTMLLLGYGIVPLLWAPLPELKARRLSIMPPYFVAAMFAFGVGASKDLQAVLVSRFFCGFFASAPVCNMSGVLMDTYDDHQRGAAMAMFAFAVSAGPLLASIVSAAIVNSYLSWRWTQYITGILMTASYINFSLNGLAKKYLLIPVQLLLDPICALMTLYASLVYTILYLTFSTFPIEYEHERGWNPLTASLPQIGTLIGCILAGGVHLANDSFFSRRLAQNDDRPVPEARLPPMMIGSIIFTAGLFLWGWISFSSVLWVGSVFGVGLIGLGFLCIFQANLNYLIDTFQYNVASALAANTVVRSIMAGAFPIFADAPFHNLTIPWACTLLGCIAALMIPILFCFYTFGYRIRAREEFSRAST